MCKVSCHLYFRFVVLGERHFLFVLTFISREGAGGGGGGYLVMKMWGAFPPHPPVASVSFPPVSFSSVSCSLASFSPRCGSGAVNPREEVLHRGQSGVAEKLPIEQRNGEICKWARVSNIHSLSLCNSYQSIE